MRATAGSDHAFASCEVMRSHDGPPFCLCDMIPYENTSANAPPKSRAGSRSSPYFCSECCSCIFPVKHRISSLDFPQHHSSLAVSSEQEVTRTLLIKLLHAFQFDVYPADHICVSIELSSILKRHLQPCCSCASRRSCQRAL